MKDSVLASQNLVPPAKMDEILDESIVKTKYVPREVPGYLKDFPVNIIYLTLRFGGYVPLRSKEK